MIYMVPACTLRPTTSWHNKHLHTILQNIQINEEVLHSWEVDLAVSNCKVNRWWKKILWPMVWWARTPKAHDSWSEEGEAQFATKPCTIHNSQMKNFTLTSSQLRPCMVHPTNQKHYLSPCSRNNTIDIIYDNTLQHLLALLYKVKK